MEIPQPLPRPSFVFRTDGNYSDEADRVFGDWSKAVGQRLDTIPDGSSSGDITRPRCFLLSDACKRKDITYIVMHHRYCLWSLDRRHVHHLMGPCSPDAIDSGFSALRVLLKPNDSLPPEQLAWMANFPDRTFDAYIPTPMLDSITRSIYEFISSLTTRWQDFQTSILLRKFPILVCEAEQVLKCSSWIVQDLLFTLTRRILGCQDGPTARLFGDVFNRDRLFEASARAKGLQQAELAYARDELVQNYIDLVKNLPSPQPSMRKCKSHILFISFAHFHTGPSPATPSPNVGLTTGSAAQGVNPSPNPVVNTSLPKMNSDSPQGAPAVANPPHTEHRRRPPAPIILSSSPVVAPEQGSQSPNVAASASRPTQAFSQAPRPIPAQPTLAELLPEHGLDPATGQVRLIPENEYPKATYGVQSFSVGLHLSLQRSPKRLPIHNVPTTYYQYVEELVVQPTKLAVGPHLSTIVLSLAEDQLRNLPIQEGALDIFSLPIARFQNNTCRFRLRVARVDPAHAATDLNWTTLASIWPEEMSMTINNMHCILSRKQHFHMDLPLELTHYVKAGPNEVCVSLPSLTEKENGYEYFLAVEKVITRNHDSILHDIHHAPRISTETTKANIRQRVGASDTNEIAVLGRTLNVSACDPLSSKLCDIPVRGIDCKHIECFDLEIWLQSRNKKPRAGPTEPCLVDGWSCPLCGGDARPNQLRVCDYFTDITRHLREPSCSEVRTISIDGNGDWKPLSSQAPTRKLTSPNSTKPRELQQRLHHVARAIEVIEIPDD